MLLKWNSKETQFTHANISSVQFLYSKSKAPLLKQNQAFSQQKENTIKHLQRIINIWKCQKSLQKQRMS